MSGYGWSCAWCGRCADLSPLRRLRVLARRIEGLGGATLLALGAVVAGYLVSSPWALLIAAPFVVYGAATSTRRSRTPTAAGERLFCSRSRCRWLLRRPRGVHQVSRTALTTWIRPESMPRSPTPSTRVAIIRLAPRSRTSFARSDTVAGDEARDCYRREAVKGHVPAAPLGWVAAACFAGDRRIDDQVGTRCYRGSAALPCRGRGPGCDAFAAGADAADCRGELAGVLVAPHGAHRGEV